MQPILCVGESFEERRQGIELDFAVGQVRDVTRDLNEEQAAKLIVAYEPVWAIGTGMVATPQSAQDAANAIRNDLKTTFGTKVSDSVRILYGGSVTSKNAAELIPSPTLTAPDRRGGPGREELAKNRSTGTEIHEITELIPRFPVCALCWSTVQSIRRYPVTALKITLQVIVVLLSFVLTLLILMHKGKGGGLSDMFGGGLTQNAGTSGVAEKNLNRWTVIIALVWVALIIGLDMMTKFNLG